MRGGFFTKFATLAHCAPLCDETNPDFIHALDFISISFSVTTTQCTYIYFFGNTLESLTMHQDALGCVKKRQNASERVRKLR